MSAPVVEELVQVVRVQAEMMKNLQIDNARLLDEKKKLQEENEELWKEVQMARVKELHQVKEPDWSDWNKYQITCGNGKITAI